MTFQEDGAVVIPDVVAHSECDRLADRVNEVGSRSAGSRCLLDHDWCRDAADNLRTRLTGELDCVAGSVIVQCTYFHKTRDKNWLVAWHQDRSIAVNARVTSSELTGWSRKEGMTFVHAPDDVLSDMFAVRLHLDDSTDHNGPLRVLSGSHHCGTLSVEQIEQARETLQETTCLVRKGGVVVMRPLLLHASSKSTTLEPRRVLHFLFARAPLPDGLAWRHVV